MTAPCKSCVGCECIDTTDESSCPSYTPKSIQKSDETELCEEYNHERELISWAYSKLHCFSFGKIEDALILDDMRLYLEDK